MNHYTHTQYVAVDHRFVTALSRDARIACASSVGLWLEAVEDRELIPVPVQEGISLVWTLSDHTFRTSLSVERPLFVWGLPAPAPPLPWCPLDTLGSRTPPADRDDIATGVR